MKLPPESFCHKITTCQFAAYFVNNLCIKKYTLLIIIVFPEDETIVYMLFCKLLLPLSSIRQEHTSLMKHVALPYSFEQLHSTPSLGGPIVYLPTPLRKDFCIIPIFLVTQTIPL